MTVTVISAKKLNNFNMAFARPSKSANAKSRLALTPRQFETASKTYLWLYPQKPSCPSHQSQKQNKLNLRYLRSRVKPQHRFACRQTFVPSATSLTCRQMSGRINDFWQYRKIALNYVSA